MNPSATDYEFRVEAQPDFSFLTVRLQANQTIKVEDDCFDHGRVTVSQFGNSQIIGRRWMAVLGDNSSRAHPSGERPKGGGRLGGVASEVAASSPRCR